MENFKHNVKLSYCSSNLDSCDHVANLDSFIPPPIILLSWHILNQIQNVI